MLDALKEIVHAIGYSLMADLVLLPVYIILGATFLGWFGIAAHKRSRSKNESEPNEDKQP